MELYAPKLDELGFRQKMLGDPETMSYNKGCGLDMPTYHNDTGCIDFPREAWEDWYARWVHAGPEKFYAYLREGGEFVGEVCLHMTEGPGIYEMGIVLDSAQRGKGYSRPGMALLLGHAFEKLGAREVTNCFQPERVAAMKLHLAAGFQVVKEESGLAHLVLSAGRYTKSSHPSGLGISF